MMKDAKNLMKNTNFKSILLKNGLKFIQLGAKIKKTLTN